MTICRPAGTANLFSAAPVAENVRITKGKGPQSNCGKPRSLPNACFTFGQVRRCWIKLCDTSTNPMGISLADRANVKSQTVLLLKFAPFLQSVLANWRRLLGTTERGSSGSTATQKSQSTLASQSWSRGRSSTSTLGQALTYARNVAATLVDISSYRESGALGRIRTPDPLIRSQVLYPAELPERGGVGFRANARGMQEQNPTKIRNLPHRLSEGIFQRWFRSHPSTIKPTVHRAHAPVPPKSPAPDLNHPCEFPPETA